MKLYYQILSLVFSIFFFIVSERIITQTDNFKDVSAQTCIIMSWISLMTFVIITSRKDKN